MTIRFIDMLGKEVISWESGGEIIQEVIFFTWRDLFLRIVDKRRPGNKKMLELMFHDIHSNFGSCLHLILCGGNIGSLVKMPS